MTLASKGKKNHLFKMFYHLYTNGVFLLVWYLKFWMVNCTNMYLGVSGYFFFFFKVLNSFV